MEKPMALSDNARGALLMMASMAGFTINDTFMKSLSDHLPLFQLLFLRGVGTIIAITVIAKWLGLLHLRFPVADRKLILIRSIAEIGSTYFFMVALFHIPLANVSAIFQALPLAITLAGMVFLGEQVGWRRLIAILIGFGGVMLIIRPGGDGFSSYSLYALASVACVVVRDLVVRRMSDHVPSLVVALGAAVAVTVSSGLASLTTEWVQPDAQDILKILGALCFLVAAYLSSIATMRVGNLGFVAPFRYTGLLWALMLGLVIFGDWPDGLTLIGAMIIVATGLFTLFRERMLAATQRRATALAQSAAP